MQVKSTKYYATLTAALFFLFNCVVMSYLIYSVHHSIKSEKQAIAVLLIIEKVHKNVLLAETGQRGYVLTQEAEYLTPYVDAIKRIDILLNDLKNSVDKTPALKRLDNTLNEKIDLRIERLRQVVKLIEDNKQNLALEAISSDVGLELMLDVGDVIDSMKDNQLNFLDQLKHKSSYLIQIAFLLLIVTNIVGFLMVMYFSYSFRKMAARDIRLSDDLLSANKNLESRVSQRTKELTEKTDELIRSNKELEDFAYVASHDLQEPLRKIQAFGDRLVKHCNEQLDDKGRDYLSRMRNASERMSTLINDLLSFSRIATQAEEFVDINLNELWAGIEQNYSDTLEEIAAKIEVAALPIVKGDRSQLSQVFSNLLNNAVKYRQASTTLFIQVDQFDVSIEEVRQRFEPTMDNYVKITFADNGIGFDESFSEKIFTMFQRLHGRTDYDGTGIGLAICRKVIERHGGSIFVERSAPNIGTTFAIYLPSTYPS